VNPKTIYAGCDFGVFVSPDRGQNWIAYSTGFWDATQVFDLQIDANNKLIAATHGKGVFRSDLYVNIITPVTLVNFNGVAQPNYNELKWVTEQEQNLLQYELERSADGVTYTRIATVAARNQTTQSVYNFLDHTAPFESYYRLRMRDRDGSFTYSSIVFIRRPYGKAEFNVMGNPFQNTIVLKYKLPRDQKISVNLFNSAGALMRKEEYAATAGLGMYTINDLERLAKGIYMLKVESGTETQIIKLLKN
jgi:hypothetical protein